MPAMKESFWSFFVSGILGLALGLSHVHGVDAYRRKEVAKDAVLLKSCELQERTFEPH